MIVTDNQWLEDAFLRWDEKKLVSPVHYMSQSVSSWKFTLKIALDCLEVGVKY